MIIETAIKPEEDLDLLCNSLNAQAGRFSYSDLALHNYLLRAQAAINSLREMLENEREFAEELKDMMRGGLTFMKGVKPCPYCGGEIEIKQLDNDPYDDHEIFSIRCKKCGAYVVKGQGFAGELTAEANERILQFKKRTGKNYITN